MRGAHRILTRLCVFVCVPCSSRKTVASLLTHLASKWAGAPALLHLAPDAPLRLFPLEAAAPALHAGWGAEAGATLAAELMHSDAAARAAELPPGVFQLKYGWTAAPAAPPATQREQHCARAAPPAYAPPQALAAAAAPIAPPPPQQQAPAAAVAAAPGSFLSLMLESAPPPPQQQSLGRAAPASFTTTPVTPALAYGAAAPPAQRQLMHAGDDGTRACNAAAASSLCVRVLITRN